MNRYARLALLLLVLTLSVGMLSAAINILGDITRLELDEDKPGPANPMMNPGALGKQSDEVEVGGVSRRASLQLTPEARVGDYVLLHTGFAINTVDPQEAEETLKLLTEIAEQI